MKMEKGLVVLTVTVMAVLFSGASGQSDCTNVLVSLSPCLNYITGNSSTPTQQCCGQLGSVVRSSPQCLCQVLNGGGSQLGIKVNQTQALALPRVCNVQTPPASSCNGGGSSTDSPAGSPNTPGKGDGSKTDGDGSSSDGSSIKLSSSIFSFLLAAFSAAVFTTY